MRVTVILASLLPASCAPQPQEVEFFIPLVPPAMIRTVCDKQVAGEELAAFEAEIYTWHCGGGEKFLLGRSLLGETEPLPPESVVLAKAQRSGRDSLHLDELQVLDYACIEQNLQASYCRCRHPAGSSAWPHAC